MKEKHDKAIDKKTIVYYYVLKRQYCKKYLNTLHEVEEQYEVINNEHDKTYRSILSDLEEAVKVINKVLKLRGKNKISKEEIEVFNSSFVTNQYKNRQADMVYRLKESNIFFLIEHQNKQDYSMPFRIQEYKLEIAKSAINIKKLKTKEYNIPVVIPIVLYTGTKQWKASVNLEEIKDQRLRNINMAKYNLIDMNKYTKEELLKSNQLLDKVYLIEKAKNANEIEELIKQIIPRLKEEDKKQKFINMLMTTQKSKINTEECKELINSLIGGEEEMVRGLELIRQEGVKQGIKIGKEEAKEEMVRGLELIRQDGRKEGIKTIVTNMFQKGLKIEEIMEVTGLSKKEIEQVQN